MPTRSPIKRKKATEKATAKADLPTCDSTCDVFLEPQETLFLSSITENLENTTVDHPSYWHSDDSATVNNHRCDEDAPKQGRRGQLNPKEEYF